MSEAIRARIAKLLNLTTERGATEDEAETAMRIAASLAAQHGIDLASLTPGEQKRKVTQKRNASEMKVHQAILAEAAASLFGVEASIYSYGKDGFEFVGREENVAMAEDMMMWLFRQVEDLYKQALPKGLSQRMRAEFRKTFKEACALRVRERARQVVAGLERTGTETQNALVVTGYFKQLQQEIDEFWEEKCKPTPEQIERARRWQEQRDAWRAANPEAARKVDKQRERDAKRAAKRKGPRVRYIKEGIGSNAGRMAADRVKLNKEVK